MAQTSSAQEAGRPQPQTTVEASGPFIRNSQPGRAPIYSVANQAFSGTLTQPLVARPGYFRNFRVTHTLTTGGTLTSGTLQADAPFNLNALIQLKDAFGTPLLVGDGYSISNLVNLYGGSFGLLNGNNASQNLPSYTAISTTTGAGTFSYSLPLEFSKAYGVLSAANASLLPTLQFNYNPLTSILGSSVTGTAPTITTQVDTDFYWLPEGTQGVEPPGLGTTRQWQVVQANPIVSSGQSARIQFPRLGGYLDTVVAIARDSTGARVDSAWPSRLQWYVDGVPLIDTTMPELYDDMAIQYGFGVGANVTTRPTGTIAFCRKTSLNQNSLGLLDSGEVFLSTNPATLLELNFSPAGTISTGNNTATISCLVGQIVPTGALIQGLPEL
jgi:hypothetical protein